jgi:hypothetical protein
MPRRTFTTADLAPLREAVQQVLEREPDAAVVAAAAQPIKRRIPTAAHEQLTDVRLPDDVATSTSPGGVPLHEIAKAVQDEVPSVTGLSITPEGLSVKFATPPTPAQQRKITALLTDKTRLEGLLPRVVPVTAAFAAAGGDEQLLDVLRDPRSTNSAWMRAFRTWAAANLFPPAGEDGT